MGIKLPQPCYDPVGGSGLNGTDDDFHREMHKTKEKKKPDSFWISDGPKYIFYISAAVGIVFLVISVYLYDRAMGVGHMIRAAECAQVHVFAERVAKSKFVEYDQLRQKTGKDLVSCMDEGL